MTLAIVATALLTAAGSPLKLDVSMSPWTATPEPLTFCLALSALRALEIDGCGGFAGATNALTAHAFVRRHLIESKPLELAAGVGVGARAMRYCSSFGCGYSAGPEGLLSAEATYWFSERVGGSVQADGGVALQWLEAAPGVTRTAWRFPIRLMFGVSFVL